MRFFRELGALGCKQSISVDVLPRIAGAIGLDSWRELLRHTDLSKREARDHQSKRLLRLH